MPYIKEGQTVQWQNNTQKTKDWETQASSIIKNKTNKQTNKQRQKTKQKSERN